MSEQEFFGMSLESMEKLLNEPSYTLPRRLNRYQRREYLKQLGENIRMNKFSIYIESVLDFDDSEFRYESIGQFDKENFTKEELTNAVNLYWDYNGEDVMTAPIVERIIEAIKDGEEDFDFLEVDETVDFESCRRRFTVRIVG